MLPFLPHPHQAMRSEPSILDNADADEDVPAAEVYPGQQLDPRSIAHPASRLTSLWKHLAGRLLLAHQQVYRFLSGGARRHALILSPTTVYQHNAVPQWQATWQLESGPPAWPHARSFVGPLLHLDLPTAVNRTLERWHGRWREANSPNLLHIYPQCAAGDGPYDARFSPTIGLVSVYVPNQLFLVLLQSGAWEQASLSPHRLLQDAAAGSPILIDFQAMIMVRPFCLPLSHLARILRLPEP